MPNLSMTPARVGRAHRRPFARRLIGLAAGAAIAGTMVTAMPAQAVERPAPVEQGYQAQDRGLGVTLKAGPILLKKYGFRDEHLGLLSVDGKWGICYDYGLKSPDGHWVDGPVAGIAKGKTRDQITWIANRYWPDAQKSDRAAAAYKSAINRLRSKEFASDWKASYVPQLKAQGKTSWVTLADQMLAESAKYAGPAKLTVDLSKPAPGGMGVAVAKLTVGGRAYPGMAVKWTLTGGVATALGKTTGKDGTAKLSYTRGGGAVSVKAVASVPEWREAGFSIPSSGKIQHLVRGGYSTTVTAGGKFDSLPGITVSSKCEQDCHGRPPVTFSAKASSSPMRWQALVGGKVAKTLELGTGKSGSATFTGQDGQRVTFRYSVMVGGKWSAYRAITKVFDVVCPAAPLIRFEGSCDCDGRGMVVFHLTAPGGPRVYDVTLGAETKRISGTQTADLTVPIAQLAGARVTYDALDKTGKRLGGGVLTPWSR